MTRYDDTKLSELWVRGLVTEQELVAAGRAYLATSPEFEQKVRWAENQLLSDIAAARKDISRSQAQWWQNQKYNRQGALLHLHIRCDEARKWRGDLGLFREDVFEFFETFDGRWLDIALVTFPSYWAH